MLFLRKVPILNNDKKHILENNKFKSIFFNFMNPKILNSIQKIPAKFIGNQFEVTLDTVSIDSRSLQNGPQTLFFALIGANHDAHHYIKDLIATGVRNFVVTHIPEGFTTFRNMSNHKIANARCN